MRTFENHLVPGLLQTEDYARALIDAVRPSVPSEEIERRVTARMTRQEALTKKDPLNLWAILDKSVLRRMIGGRGVMRQPLRGFGMSEAPSLMGIKTFGCPCPCSAWA